eukprot:CAMPEP_0201512840 /NCGR_PEP_ID=MMETSP0161_2-20130828/5012_1 /ASSEMBLY_ACC=CAM_ASM_000251 /TAXON_ID=180227 /ORGANISM="Neoparamoeba aestuarina, Strain SoJaBio B1-5/56/2" /LENGTH=196 /DNA_ID=CAMNT_0047908829 /DNA_START=285 /DNA_END=875 /DNA_ORIENTATION=-
MESELEPEEADAFASLLKQLLGAAGVGKSTLTVQLVQHIFVEEYDPTIEDSYRKQARIDGELVLLDILDTTDTEYSGMRESYIVGGEAFIFIYSITARSTFEEVEEYVRFVMNVKNVSHVPLVICGNKCDLEEYRQVDMAEGKEKAALYNGPFFETSAKTRINVEECFYEVVREVRKYNKVDFQRKNSSRSTCSLL